jgi:hypothetical protein
VDRAKFSDEKQQTRENLKSATTTTTSKIKTSKAMSNTTTLTSPTQ